MAKNITNFTPENYSRFIDILLKELEVQAKQEVQASIKKVRAVASGQLLESVTAFAQRTSLTNASVVVGSNDRAAIPIEEGFPPGFVPISRIMQWMVDKGLTPSTSAAFAIANKLLDQGYEARAPFEKAEESFAAKIDDIILDTLERYDII